MFKKDYALAAAWTLVLAAVVCLTIAKAHIDGGPLWNADIQARREVRLLPLQEFYRPSIWYGPWLNFFGNIALFVSVGFLARRRAAPVGLALSAAIEVTQYLTFSGYSDIDDLICNTLGAALGGWVSLHLAGRPYRFAAGVLALGSLVVVAAFAGLWLVQLS
ncbi:VanZ family protein [uncultured Corynebacterium sp.]|uniref:VanZ family protein n=1 Tax=uncultured Corynebacterium sp. TaxID=159447 RepID=UPI002597B17F|nr:VanZ family protein [uncultured Corynebacterium sp.]